MSRPHDLGSIMLERLLYSILFDVQRRSTTWVSSNSSLVELSAIMPDCLVRIHSSETGAKKEGWSSLHRQANQTNPA